MSEHVHINSTSVSPQLNICITSFMNSLLAKFSRPTPIEAINTKNHGLINYRLFRLNNYKYLWNVYCQSQGDVCINTLFTPVVQ